MRTWEQLSRLEQEEIRGIVRGTNIRNWRKFGVAHNVSGDSLRHALDPKWAKRRRDRNASARWRAKQPDYEPTPREQRNAKHAERADAYRLLRLIPGDTRTVTGRICGDPLPGRSVLDRERGRHG